MIKVKVEPVEAYDSVSEQFLELPGGIFRFENSLRAIAKWESKYQKSWFETCKKKNVTEEQLLDFMCCMCIDGNFHKEYITPQLRDILFDYINTKHSATSVSSKGKRSRQVMTSELIYASMAIARVPFECDKWEINRLIMTLECVTVLQNPKKNKTRVPQQEVLKEYDQINKRNRARFNSKG